LVARDEKKRREQEKEKRREQKERRVQETKARWAGGTMGMVGGGGEQQQQEGALQRHVMALIVGHLRENNLNQVTTPPLLFVCFGFFFLSFSHVLLLHSALLLHMSVSFTMFFVFTTGILLLLLFLFPGALLLRVLE
jgi:hypothetical protein